MTKKRSSEIFAVQMEIFLKSWSAKNLSVPPNSAPGLRHCPHNKSTRPLFCFRFDTVKVIRQTYTHTCMHTIHIQRYIGLHKSHPPLSHRPQPMGIIMIFIHFGHFYSVSLSPLLFRGAPDHSN